jgi:hypothetical protein
MPETEKKTAAKPTGRNAAAETGARLEAERQQRVEKLANQTFWERLAAPFPLDQIERKPQPLRRGDEDRGQCREGSRYSADGTYCGGYHARSVHLDYVGHAGITMRLNEVATPAGWDWAPMVSTPEGFPSMGKEFWITLTITDDQGTTVTKRGVGDQFGSSSKEAIGDALRNAAMRFGVGTYLWSKSEAALDLKRATDEYVAPEPDERPAASQRPQQRREEPQSQAPPELPPHVTQVGAMVRTLNDAQKSVLAGWWTQQANNGRMPLQANWQAVTPEQTAMVEDAVAQIIERDQELARLEALEQSQAQEPPDPQ